MSGLLRPLATGRRNESGSAWLLEMDGCEILLDAGPGPWLAQVNRVDAVVITHAHHDHVGGLLDLVEKFPRLPRYGTFATLRYLRHVLQHELRQRGGLISRADALVDTMQAKKFHEEFEVGSLKVSLHPSGHVDGSAMVCVQGSSRVLYTGDWSAFETFSGLAVQWPGQVDVLVLECSVAHLRHLDDYDVAQTSQMLKATSPVLVVATGLGEAQAAYALLNDGRDVVIHENLQPFIRSEEGLSDEAFGQALEAGASGIVGGKELNIDSASYKAVARVFERRDYHLVFLNGLPERCLASQVVRSGDRAKVRGFGRRRCKVLQLPLPFHSSRPAIIEAVRHVQPQTVVLTHNDPGVLHAVARHLQKAMPGLQVVVPDDAPIVFGLG